jgi:hypothetical protein
MPGVPPQAAASVGNIAEARQAFQRHAAPVQRKRAAMASSPAGRTAGQAMTGIRPVATAASAAASGGTRPLEELKQPDHMAAKQS